MRRRWRITTVRGKIIYVVVGWVAIALFLWALRTWLLAADQWPCETIGFVLNVAFTLVGVRVFRGFMEPVDPPRRPWRWTGRPLAGFWLGGLYLFLALLSLVGYWPSHGRPPNYYDAALGSAQFLLFGIGYLRSSLALRRLRVLWSKRRRDVAGASNPG